MQFEFVPIAWNNGVMEIGMSILIDAVHMVNSFLKGFSNILMIHCYRTKYSKIPQFHHTR